MRNSRHLCASAIALLIAAAGTASGQLVVGNDASSGQMYVIDLVNPANSRTLVGLTTDFQVAGIAADNAGGVLYWMDGTTRLVRATMSTGGTLTAVSIGTTMVAGSSAAMTGLAWDAAAGMLVGYKSTNSATAPEGFYQINTATAEGTLLYALPNTADDYGGFDYDDATDTFYGCNDNTTADVRGLYRINKPWTSPTFTRLDAYPGTDTDIDGCAAGGGRVYLVNDTASQGAFVWNIAAGAYEAPISPLPYTVSGTFAGGAWAPGLLVPPSGADVAITKTDAPDPVIIPPGSNITYTVTVTNNGPEMATGVTLTDVLPGNTSFVSVGAPGIHNNGTVTADLGDMAMGASVSFQIVVSPNSTGSVTNIAAVSTTSSDPIASNNSATATTTVRNPLADLSAAITAPATCSVPVGGTASYLFTLDNSGPEAADGTSLVVTFPSNVTFLSSIPPLTPAGDTLTLDLGSVGSGGGGSISADFRIDSGTSVVVGAAAASATADPNTGNNSAGHSLTVPSDPPATAAAAAIFSTIADNDSSLVPNLGGARFSSTGGIQRPFRSPNGQHFSVIVDTDLPTTSDQVLIVGSEDGSYNVAVQEGVTLLPEGDTLGIFDSVSGINDAGDFVFGNNTDEANNDEVIVKSQDEGLVTVARENLPLPTTPSLLYGTTSGSPSIQNDGTVSFYTNLVNATTSTDTAYLSDDGNTILAQEGTTIPTNQAGGTTYPYDLFQTGATEGAGLSLDADGAHFCGMIELATAPTAEDKTMVIDNDVRLQEGQVIPGSGFASPIASASPLTNWMMSNGDWLSYGSNSDGSDWVVRNGSVIARTGDPIHTGSSFTWGATFYTQTWFMAAGNNRGDYVVGGVFEGPLEANAAIVLNGESIIARENDPVDLDNNGVFDDAMYIRTFIDDRIFLSDTALYMVVRLRDAAAAQCGGADTDRGQALIRIALPDVGGCPACAADFNQDGGVDGADVEAFYTVWESGEGCGDVNQDGGVDGGDVEAFFAVWENGGC